MLFKGMYLFNSCHQNTWFSTDLWGLEFILNPTTEHCMQQALSVHAEGRRKEKHSNPESTVLLGSLTSHMPTEQKWKRSTLWFFTCIWVLGWAPLPRACTPGRCSYTAVTRRLAGRMNSPFSAPSRQCEQAALGSPRGQHRRSWRKQERFLTGWHCTPHLCRCCSSLHHPYTACCQGTRSNTQGKPTALHQKGMERRVQGFVDALRSEDTVPRAHLGKWTLLLSNWAGGAASAAVPIAHPASVTGVREVNSQHANHLEHPAELFVTLPFTSLSK